MMLTLDQNVALQIVTCFEQGRFRLRARIGLEKDAYFFVQDELYNQWRVVRRSNFSVCRRVKYLRVHAAATEERLATDQASWFCFPGLKGIRSPALDSRPYITRIVTNFARCEI